MYDVPLGGREGTRTKEDVAAADLELSVPRCVAVDTAGLN